ncbi:tigger transposable element-derived protein 1-like [Palaemon carinicauda]|uniref:tigger transposable element-derived protein 1-like n=1 Tax=Palaemon carinicauda TaxID=392227 RepID=UPI0035B675C5
MIRTKAKTLNDSLVPEEKSNEDDEGDDDDEEDNPAPQEKRGFVASKGWFKKFKRRFGLRRVPLYGEAALADQEAALRYVEDEFLKLIKEGSYLLEQVFNMDETGLFWKRMPSQAFLYKDEVKKPVLKAHKDRVTLLTCGNAADFMIKASLIYKSLNPLALKNKNKTLLPVYWMHCAGGHATDIHYDRVQVEFLTPNTTSLIQPMDQGVIRAFKALYTRSMMEGLISSIDEGD